MQICSHLSSSHSLIGITPTDGVPYMYGAGRQLSNVYSKRESGLSRYGRETIVIDTCRHRKTFWLTYLSCGGHKQVCTRQKVGIPALSPTYVTRSSVIVRHKLNNLFIDYSGCCRGPSCAVSYLLRDHFSVLLWLKYSAPALRVRLEMPGCALKAVS